MLFERSTDTNDSAAHSLVGVPKVSVVCDFRAELA